MIQSNQNDLIGVVRRTKECFTCTKAASIMVDRNLGTACGKPFYDHLLVAGKPYH